MHEAITSAETARQIAIAGAVFLAQDERHKAGPGLADGEAELARQVVAERGRANLRDRKASGGDHERWRFEFCIGCACDEIGCSLDFLNVRVQENAYSGVLAFGFEHAENVAGGAVAEKLAQSFLVIRDVVLFDQGNEIRGRVAGECRLGEVRIRGKEVFRTAVKVGEVAASAAGDQNFFAQAVGVFEHRDAAAALAGFDGAHQAGCAAAENECIEGVGHRAIVQGLKPAFIMELYSRRC